MPDEVLEGFLYVDSELGACFPQGSSLALAIIPGLLNLTISVVQIRLSNKQGNLRTLRVLVISFDPVMEPRNSNGTSFGTFQGP